MNPLTELADRPLHPAITPHDKHLATCGSVGMWGKRVGTTQVHTPRAAYAISGEPWFRFRNDECARICREAWKLPPPEGDFFAVAEEADRPDIGYSTRTEATSPLRKCQLARWEGYAGRPFRTALFQIGNTDFYEWSERRNDYFWHRVGRLLVLNDAGREVAASLRSRAALTKGEG